MYVRTRSGGRRGAETDAERSGGGADLKARTPHLFCGEQEPHTILWGENQKGNINKISGSPGLKSFPVSKWSNAKATDKEGGETCLGTGKKTNTNQKRP